MVKPSLKPNNAKIQAIWKAAERPPPSHIVQQELLMATEKRMEYL